MCCSMSTGRARASLGGVRQEDVVTVFILPPSAKALEERFNVRAEDEPEDVVQRRMRGASNEIQHWDEYDYVIINLRHRPFAGRRCAPSWPRSVCGESRQTGLKDFVQGLLAEL